MLYNIFYGWKLFDKVLIPKSLSIFPNLFPIEISLLLINFQLESIGLNNIYKPIINRLLVENNFIIVNLSNIPSHFLFLNDLLFSININISIQNNYLIHIPTYEELDINKKFNLDESKEISSLIGFYIKKILKDKSDSQKLLLPLVNKNLCVVKFDKLNLINFNYLKISNILIIPYVFYIRLNKKINIYESIYGKNPIQIDINSIDIFKYVDFNLHIDYIEYFNNLNKKIERLTIKMGNFRLIQDIIDLINFNVKQNIEFILCDNLQYLDYINLDSTKIFLNSSFKISESSLSPEESNKIKCIIKKINNKFISKSDLILNGYLNFNVDDKSFLNKIFNNNLPLSKNFNKISSYFSSSEIDEIFTYIKKWDSPQNKNQILKQIIDSICTRLIFFIQQFCNNPIYNNKLFIIKDANSSRGLGISGFNCSNYHRLSNFSKKIFISLIFNLEQIYKPNTSLLKLITDILNINLVIQEFIESPLVYKNDVSQFKFKSRIYILLEQRPNLNIIYHLYKNFSMDYLPVKDLSKFFYKEISNITDALSHSSNFISNSSGNFDTIKEFNSNYSDINSVLNYLPETFKNNYLSIMQQFIINFGNDFQIINSKIPLFTNYYKNQINKSILKILSLDIIFDENDEYNIKIIEINSGGAIYNSDFINDYFYFILTGILNNFISYDSSKPSPSYPNPSTNKIT